MMVASRRRLSLALNQVSRLYGIRLNRHYSYNSYYRANVAFRAETDQGVYLIKPVPNEYLRVLRAHRWVRMLESAGYPHIPHWLRSLKGKPIVRLNRRYYYMTSWIEGKELGAAEPELEELGRVLGRLHQTSKQLLEGTCGASYTGLFWNKQVLLKKQFTLHLPRLMRHKGRIGRWFRRERGRCVLLAAEAARTLRSAGVQALLRSEKLRPAIIHGDVTRPNIVCTDERIYLIDWDRARRGSVYMELAKLLTNTTHFSIPLMAAALRGYEEQCPLTREERLLVSALFRMPSEVWYAARDIAAGKSTAPALFDTVEKTWSSRLAAIAWLDRWAAGGLTS
ncbi:phosphotransferase [Paenibacillus piri]|uniref:Aminoglycoside phosphotransferase domain-containing protein n=1 Tax=Paenibacillus piri TaxID=2547395 RepID=A0A4R5KKX3_9BACL|nr:phosphotransferase [Paenibacillus piri]TDF95080.1 hypothetical protein E1757_21330 [Paenibacillus piri]